ncbi:MAG: hypothetical protein WBF42_04830, partial [Terracidiphilus sp.]
FDTCMAEFVRATGIPVAWAELWWQFISIFLILLASWSIISQLFEDAVARWAGIAMLGAMFTLPVAGTALYIVDQYLHPRAMATALILFAVSRILAQKQWQAVPMLAMSFALHPLMGALGISFCCVLSLVLIEPVHDRLRLLIWREVPQATMPAIVLLPVGWLFEPPSPIWLRAIGTRHWFRLYQWTWYEWLGAIAPIAIFWVLARIARKRRNLKLAQVATAIFIYSIFQQAVAMVILGPKELVTLTALEPMRYLHIVYIFLTLIGGAYLGEYILGTKKWRWAAFLLLASGGMLYAQRQIFSGTEHIEWPGASSSNPWLQAFAWVRVNTPTDAYFAMDPNYMAAPGEDYHSFRALAERSQLADAIKDTSVISKVPELGPTWEKQVAAQAGWSHFELSDFERLKHDFGVNWVLVSYPQAPGLDCRWHNGTLAVCQIP